MEETSNEDYCRFRTVVYQTIDLLGLKDWSVTVRHAAVENASYATIATDHVGRVAVITFNKIKDTVAEGYDPVRAAKHEVLELLLSPLVRLANSRCILPEDIEAETHAIIRRLERLNMS